MSNLDWGFAEGSTPRDRPTYRHSKPHTAPEPAHGSLRRSARRSRGLLRMPASQIGRFRPENVFPSRCRLESGHRVEPRPYKVARFFRLNVWRPHHAVGQLDRDQLGQQAGETSRRSLLRFLSESERAMLVTAIGSLPTPSAFSSLRRRNPVQPLS